MSSRAKGHRWPLGIPGTTVARESRVDDARFTWLSVLSEIEPRILSELVDASAANKVNDWARRWRLDTPWIRAHVESTLRDWTEQPATHGYFWADRDDTGVGWAAEGTRVQGTAWYKDAAVFDWLARVHLANATYTELASEAGTSTQRISKACRALAELMDLPLRPARRGRPRNEPIC